MPAARSALDILRHAAEVLADDGDEALAAAVSALIAAWRKRGLPTGDGRPARKEGLPPYSQSVARKAMQARDRERVAAARELSRRLRQQ